MHITFKWNAKKGHMTICPKSMDTLTAEFEHSPITVLDFLMDTHMAVVDEYNSALEAFCQGVHSTDTRH